MFGVRMQVESVEYDIADICHYKGYGQWYQSEQRHFWRAKGWPGWLNVFDREDHLCQCIQDLPRFRVLPITTNNNILRRNRS